MQTIQLGHKKIGAKHKTFVIAEIGVNHNGDLDLAKEMMVCAKTAGADAVKFQAFRAKRICDRQLKETKNVKKITGGTTSSYAMYKKLELSAKDFQEIMSYAQDIGILCLASVFDEKSARRMCDLEAPAFKIASSDVTHLPLITSTASLQRPMIISTGLSNLHEVALAVEACYAVGNKDVILLHCTACYPPKDDEINLRAMQTLQSTFQLICGYSDHSCGPEMSLGAVALGARVIEKHFTSDHALAGPDQTLSADPGEFQALVQGIRRIEKALGHGRKEPSFEECTQRVQSRRSIFAHKTIKKGDRLTEDNTIIIKPALGIAPSQYDHVLGRKAKRRIHAYEPIRWEMI